MVHRTAGFSSAGGAAYQEPGVRVTTLGTSGCKFILAEQCEWLKLLPRGDRTTVSG